MLLFLALCFFGVAIAGASAFVIFWPLTLIHVRDRHAGTAVDFGSGAFMNPRALSWLLSGAYRERSDSALSGLATPARIALITLMIGLGTAGALWLGAEFLT